MALTEIPSELSSTPSIVDGGNATAITIDSSDRVFIGKTATGLGTSGTEINPNGYVQITEDQSPPLYLNRLSTDGNIVNFYKDGASKGTIGTTTSAGGSRFAIGGVGDPGIIFAGTGVFPSAGLTASNGASDLGSANYRWKDIFLSGGVNFSANANAGGMTSETLGDYEEGTWTPTLAGHYGTYGTTFNQGTRNGVYTKIGNLVTLSMEINNAGVAAANNGDIITIIGLPFNIGGYGIVASHANNAASSHVGGGWTSISATSLGNLGNNGTASGGWSWLTGNNFSTSGVAIRLTVTYRVS